MPHTPVVTIIMATYNRSNIVTYAIQTVLSQTEQDWELLVIGDHCTDNTADVIASFNDPRIRFINLPANIGEQSGPNNVGLKQARSEFIAFLNHDDLWFSNHLAACLDTIRLTTADLVFGVCALVMPDGQVNIGEVMPDSKYHPAYFIPASGWLFRKEIVNEVGYWLSYRAIWLYPSHDWLRRVYRKGKRIVPIRQLTWLAIPSGNRKNSYSERQSEEHAYYFSQISTNPAFKEELLTKVVFDQREQQSRFEGGKLMWQGAKNTIKKRFIALGLTPVELRFMWQFWWKGKALDKLRQTRGLPKLNRNE
ncbi:glycosyltransferase family 2 protein [Spirosoma panaciterrae]|uniref:glycosyltransferase family 2 protein n=1 Tax=Spirosoma panaciterrae TaxID=496058 RepID=UPI001FDF5880|nr:glycosyltransferase family A protein [Spirosoma panaciterrae]